MVKISNSLARSFAKAVIIQNGNDNTSKTLYGEVVQDEGVNYVRIDGSTELTPFSSVMDAVPGNRVSVTIDKGKATIVGNVSAPAQNTANFPEGSVNTASLYGPIDGDTLTIKNINASNIKSGTIDASLITVTNIDASSIKAGAITTNHISTDGLNASVIKTGKLSGDRIDAHTITSDHISTDGLSANVIKTGILDASQVTVSNLSASVIQTGTLDASKANVTNINASNITTGTLDGTKATITNINASNINTGTLNASLIKTGTLDASQATITNINANNITTGKLSGNRIDSHTITSDHISTSGLNASVIESTSLNSAVGNVIRAVVDTALIRELVAGDITSLSTSTQNLIIGNGDYGTIEVNGTLIQFKDNTQNHNVYIQLGKDAQGNNSLIVKNQNGATILDSSGVTANAIADELIVNDMLKQKDANYTGISANRLNIDSVVTGINNGTSTINTSKIYFDEGSQTLNTKLSSMTSDISGINTNLSTNYYTKTETNSQVSSIIGNTTINRNGTDVNMLSALNSVIDTATEHTQTISSINTTLGTKASASQTITSDTIHYLATSLASGVTTSTSGWSTQPQTMTATNKYLWIYHTYTYADSTAQNPHTSNTTPVIGGVYGNTGAQGNPGTSVTVSSIQYAASASNTTAPTSGWQTSIPSVSAGQYLWTKTTYSDNNVAYSVARQGSNGSNGSDGTSVTISSTSVTYQAGTSGTTKPTGTWSTTIPSVSAGQYLWTKTVVTYSDGTSTESYSVARQGANGTGVTISSTSVTYQAGTSETTAPTGTWSTTIPSVSAGQYLWTKTVVTYSNSTSTIAYSVARQGVNGTNGSDGTSVTVSSVQYAGSTSNTTAPTNGWQLSIPSVSAGQYLWTKTTYSDNNVAYSVARQGQNGSNGTSITISSTSITYQTSNSGTTAPTGTWSTSIPSVSAGQYLWTKTYVKYSDNTETTSYSVARTGTQGPQGVSVASVETLYYAHTGTTAPAKPSSEITSTSTGTGAWTKAVPTLTATNRYMYRCDQIKYSPSGISWSDVVLDNSLTDLTSRMTTAESKITDSAIVNTVASNMKNCGRNLLHGTSGAPTTRTFPTSGNYSEGEQYITSIIPTSTSYTVSFEAKSTVAGDKITNYFYSPGTTTGALTSQGTTSTATDGAVDITLTTGWVRYWIKYTQTAASSCKRVLVGRCITNKGTGTVSIRKVQLEEGTVPTDWSVAPDEGINLTLDTLSISSPTSYNCARIPLTKNLEAGKTYTLQLWGCVLDSGSSGLRAYWGGGNIALTGYINPDVNGYASVVFSVTDANASGAGAYNLWIDMYNFPNGHTGRNCTIGKWKLEEGGAATPWSPAPVQIASMTKVEQLTDKISMIVANDSTSSSVVLTPDALTAIANNINLNGKVNFNDLTASAKSSIASNTLSNIYSTGTTTIDGGKITTHTITSDHISTNGLSANVIKTGTLDASRVTVTNIDGGQITAGSISADKINTDELAVSIFESIIEEDTEWSSKAYVTFIHGDYIECGYYDSSDASLSKNVLIADHDYASLHDFEFMSCNPTRTDGVDLNKIKLPYGTKITPSRMLHFGNDEDNLTNVLKLGGAHTHTSNNSGTRGGTRGVGEEETPIIGGGIWCKGHRLMKPGEEYYKESDKSKISQIPWLSKHLCSISRSGVTVEHTMTSVTLNVTSSDNTNFQQIYNSERLSWSTLLDGDYIENKECTLCCSSITTTYSGGSGPRLYLVIYENETEGNALLSVYVSPSTTRQTFTWPSNGRYYQLIYRAEQTKGTASVNTVVVFNNPAVVIGNFTGTSVGNPSDITVSDNYIITSDGDVHLRNSNIDALIMNNVYDNDLQCISGLYGMTTTRHLGYDASTHHNLIPTMATLAFWNGRYNSSSSKLAYCNKGAFGTMATKNTVTATITGFTQGNLDTYSLGPNVFTKVGSFSVPAGKGILIVTIRTGSNTNVRGYMGISGNASATSLERGYFSDFTATAQGTDYAASATVTTPFNHSAATTWYIYMKTNASANIYPHYSYQLLAPTIGYT